MLIPHCVTANVAFVLIHREWEPRYTTATLVAIGIFGGVIYGVFGAIILWLFVVIVDRWNNYHPNSIDPLALDPLTGLPTRQWLRQRLAVEFNRARRYRLPLSILVVDMDQFAKINETHLMVGGDKLLAEIARRIVSLGRSGDRVVRDGGDQFTLLLPEADRDEACVQASRIRQALASTPIVLEMYGSTVEVVVTASVGIACLTSENKDPWNLFVRARQAVNHAKNSGRNCVVLANG